MRTIIVGAQIAQQHETSLAQVCGQPLRRQAKFPRLAGCVDIGDSFAGAGKFTRPVQDAFVHIGEDEAASGREPAGPGDHIGHHVGIQILADAFPDHDRGTRRIEAGGAHRRIEIVFFEIHLDEGHPRQIYASCSQTLLLHCRGIGVIDFEDARRCKRVQPPRPRIETRTEQHHLIGARCRLPDPFVDQPGSRHAGGSRARRTAVDVAVQKRRSRPQAEQFCREPQIGRQQRARIGIGKGPLARRTRMLGRAENRHEFGGSAWLVGTHIGPPQKEHLFFL